jgi:hypothetical protein
MRGPRLENLRCLTLVLLVAALVGWRPSADSSGHPYTPQETSPANLKIAFIGDGGLGPDSVAVLNLIKSEGADAVLHSGDLEYTDNPAAWEAQINSVLGPDFPYFVTIGNHDELAWKGATGYQQYIINRFNRLGVTWSGDLGVQSSFHYKGLFFVNTAPGISSGFDSGNSDGYIRDQLAADNSVWSICSWHKDMKLMQVGGKADETGWGVYEEARKGGAIIATAHEHSYSRTHLLSSVVNQTVASTASTLTLTKGNAFAFVSGLGGSSVRPQLLAGPWWASISASTCLAGDPVCQPSPNFGALFGVFNVDGQPNKAFFYFKDVSGRIVDSFTVISNVELPVVNSLLPARGNAGSGGFTLTVNGANFGNSSVVSWNNSSRPTTLVSPTQLSATVSSADIAVAGTALVTVSGPGGSSNSAAFTIDPPLPAITMLQPTAVEAGGNGFTLTVGGNNFVNGSVVRWNGSTRPTTFISSSQLTATISLADVASTGTAPITVSNPDGNSNVATFTIAPPSLILFTEMNSDRAIALDSVTLVRDPFLISASNSPGSDGHTRIMIFSPNLALMPADNFSSVSAQAEDAQHRLYPLTVEFVGSTPQYDWLKQIVIRLPDQLGNVNALWVSISYRGAISNKAMIGLK